MIDTILLGAIVAELALVWQALHAGRAVQRAPQRNAVVPSAAEPARSPNPTAHDLRVEALIQQVDPAWKLGDDRTHIELVPDGTGHITSARRA